MKHEALRSANLFDSGCGHLVVSRFKADGRVEAGFFLLDVFCLGVKDAGFHHFHSIADYQEGLINRLFPDENSVRMTPEAARKLTEDAICYARGLGFSPGADYKKASRVFGGITTANCDERFIFGQNDKPLYIQGPSDSPARVERTLRVLEAIEQEEVLEEIADLFQSPNDMDMFYYLAERKALLFPEAEEERVICKLEMEPALYGDVAVRVASAM